MAETKSLLSIGLHFEFQIPMEIHGAVARLGDNDGELEPACMRIWSLIMTQKFKLVENLLLV